MSNKTNIQWEQEAEARMEKVPAFVRKMAKRKIEKVAQKEGITTISAEFVGKVKTKKMD